MLVALVAAIPVAWAESADARARLADAIQLYLSGDSAGARDGLQALLADGPTLTPEVRREALAYLGDLVYAEQGADAARPIFESLLSEAPDYPMDPFKHPAEVCSYVEDLREARRVALLPPQPLPVVPPPSPYPWLALAPGGVYQFVDGRPLVGTLVLLAQAGTAAVSIVTYEEIQHDLPDDGDFGDRGHVSDADRQKREDFQRSVWINRAAGAAFWVAYAAPVIVETTSWGRARKLSLQVGPSSVTVTGRF